MMVGIGVGVLVVLGDILELLVADVAVERTESLTDLGLDGDTTGDRVLEEDELGKERYSLVLGQTSRARRCSSVSFCWRSESSSRR